MSRDPGLPNNSVANGDRPHQEENATAPVHPPESDEIQPFTGPNLLIADPRSMADTSSEHTPRPPSTFGNSRHQYAQVSTRDDNDPHIRSSFDEDEITEHFDRNLESDPLYPPPPSAYYNRGHPVRITHWGRLILTLLAVGIACFAIAAFIDVSTPMDGLEPGRDARSVADSVLAAMDRSADPCDDFYEYACGSWLRSTKLPPDRTSYTRSFGSIYDRVRLQVKDLLEKDLQETDDPVKAKAGALYASCIDQHASGPVNTLFLTPFRDSFTSLSSSKSYSKLMGELEMSSSTGLFDVGIGLDDKDPSAYAIFLGQIDLGLPHRDNYLSQSDRDVEMRKRYIDLITQLLDPPGRARLIPRQSHDVLAKDILEFETKIANFSLPPDQMRDPDLLYNKRRISEMPKELHLDEYFKALMIDTSLVNDTIIVDNPPYYEYVATEMKSLDGDESARRVVRGYLAFHLARLSAGLGLLGEKAYSENFKFSQFVYGLKKMPEKWKTCQSFTTRNLGDAVGMAFVEKHFQTSALNAAKTLSSQITKGFGVSLRKLEWMDDPTRQAALDKLSAINWKVGYSTKPDTYEDVVVSRDSLASTVQSVFKHVHTRSINRLGKPVDKSEWSMNYQEVNAYYSPVRNEMVFPAGILQPPFFSDAHPDAMNYGSIGAVIGHEMSHGFDAAGRKYDKDGMLRSWWSDSSAKQYQERSQCYVDLYDTFKPRDVDIHVNGNLTLDENIADTNGINVAYRAFKSLANNSEDGIAPPNGLLARELTNDQLFFVSYGQTWCSLYRPEALKLQMMTDPHSPGSFRVLGPLSQSEIFAKAFQCRNGTRYSPMKRCHLW